MKLNTRLFGSVEYAQTDLIHFPGGLPSFENEHDFLLLPIEGGEDNLFCLQSIMTPALSFILMNPFSLDPAYAPKLQKSELEQLHVSRDQDLCFYVLCAMKRPVDTSTVNMKCPIAINPDDQIAMQVILEQEELQMRHSLSQFASKKEGSPC